MEINNLPEETLLLIFSYIPFYDRFHVVRKTCLFWENLCNRACLWKSVIFNEELDITVEDEFLQILKLHSQSIQHLCFYATGKLTDLEMEFFKWSFPSLRRLNLSFHTVTGFFSHPDCVGQFSNLRHLELNYYNIYRQCDKFLFSSLNDMLGLRTFKILNPIPLYEDCSYTFNEIFNSNLKTVFTKMKALETVHLATDHDNIQDTTIAVMIENCLEIQEIVLRDCFQISSSSFDMLPKKTKLVTLGLSFTSIDDKGIEKIAKACPKLKSISFAGCMYVTDVSVMHLCTHCPELETLHMSDPEISFKCNITNGGLDHIATLSPLKSLIIRYSEQISDIGLSLFAKGCTNLVQLDVSGCLSVVDGTLQALAENCPFLRFANFCECVHLTEKGVNPLVVSCRWLQELDVRNCPFIEFLEFSQFVKIPTPFSRYLSEDSAHLKSKSEKADDCEDTFRENQKQILGNFMSSAEVPQEKEKNDSKTTASEEENNSVIQNQLFLDGMNLNEAIDANTNCSTSEENISTINKAQDCDDRETISIKDIKFLLEKTENKHNDDVSLQHADEHWVTNDKNLHPSIKSERPASFTSVDSHSNKYGFSLSHAAGKEMEISKLSESRRNFYSALLCSSLPNCNIHSEVRVLNLGLCSRITDESLHQISLYCPDLRSLDINGCFNTTDLGIAYIARGCKDLRYLDISSSSLIQNMKLTDQSLFSLSKFCGHLSYLHAEKNYMMTRAGFQELFLKCKTLKSVHLTSDSKSLEYISEKEIKDRKVEIQSYRKYGKNLYLLEVKFVNKFCYFHSWEEELMM